METFYLQLQNYIAVNNISFLINNCDDIAKKVMKAWVPLIV